MAHTREHPHAAVIAGMHRTLDDLREIARRLAGGTRPGHVDYLSKVNAARWIDAVCQLTRQELQTTQATPAPQPAPQPEAAPDQTPTIEYDFREIDEHGDTVSILHFARQTTAESIAKEAVESGATAAAVERHKIYEDEYKLLATYGSPAALEAGGWTCE